MTVSRNALCVLYGVAAVLALFGTWGHNAEYLSHGYLGANLQFWTDTLANPASRSITVDLLFLVIVVALWMVLEARRLNMRWVWAYLLAGMLIAISVSVPVFMIHRQRTLARRTPNTPAGQLRGVDVFGLAAVGVLTIAYTVLSFARD